MNNNRNTIKLSITCIILMLLCQCKKPKGDIYTYVPYVLPPITAEGCNTFGCLRDGKLFKPSGSTPEHRSAYYDYTDHPKLHGYLDMVAKNQYGTKSESVTFGLNNVYDTGMYPLQFIDHLTFKSGLHTRGNIYIYCQCNQLDKGRWHSDKTTYGWVHIHHLDTMERIISGTFEYDAINEVNKTDTIKIRKGRFDHKY